MGGNKKRWVVTAYDSNVPSNQADKKLSPDSGRTIDMDLFKDSSILEYLDESFKKGGLPGHPAPPASTGLKRPMSGIAEGHNVNIDSNREPVKLDVAQDVSKLTNEQHALMKGYAYCRSRLIMPGMVAQEVKRTAKNPCRCKDFRVISICFSVPYFLSWCREGGSNPHECYLGGF